MEDGQQINEKIDYLNIYLYRPRSLSLLESTYKDIFSFVTLNVSNLSYNLLIPYLVNMLINEWIHDKGLSCHSIY